VVTWVPLWVAPNLITMLGLIVNVLTSLVLMWYCPTATEDAPRLAALCCGLGLFIYQTLDAIDGKQARRTNTSSPLGELFDHGCDSLSTVFVTLAGGCAVSLGRYPTFLLLQCTAASVMFYCAHWQAYVSGTMRFGKVDVTEAQICVMIVMFLTAFLGPWFWSVEVRREKLKIQGKNFDQTCQKLQLFGFLALCMSPTIVGCTCSAWSLLETLHIISLGGAGKNGSTVAVSAHMCLACRR